MIAEVSAERAQQYRDDGFLSPIRVLDAAEAEQARANFDAYEAGLGSALFDAAPRDRRLLLQETHVVLPWVYALASHANILDVVAALLGPDLIIWSTQWFPKPPGDPTYINWHQDGAYWGLQPSDVCTAWVALTPSTSANGCLRVVPASHLQILPHDETDDEASGLSRGQQVAKVVDERAARDLVLDTGEMSVHHVGIVHGSRPNKSNVARVGLAIRYVTPQVEQQGDARPWGILARGVDTVGNFELIAPPDVERPDELRRRYV